jgi:2-methylcitrate dehydratase PrpD
MSPEPIGDDFSGMLGEFVADLERRDLTDKLVRTVERCFIDTIGVTLAGATEGAGSVAGSVTASELGGSGSATLLGRSGSASVTDAVFANGAAAHSLDFDDVSDSINGHSSACLVPAILAVAEDQNASGSEAITAFAAGFEVASRISAPINPSHYERGWHATATMGPFGVAAAVSHLLGLNANQSTHALNIAASMPAGLKRNFGTMTKPMHVGQAARSGLTAAFLAREGFDANGDAIAGDGGFFDLYSGDDGPDLDEQFRANDWGDLTRKTILVKRYPCCLGMHTALAAALDHRRSTEMAKPGVVGWRGPVRGNRTAVRQPGPFLVRTG